MEEQKKNSTGTLQQNLEALVFTGMPAGFFFRYGLVLQSEGNDLGRIISVAAFLVGVFFVFPIKPFWQPLIAVAVGIGIADIVQLFSG